jgi:hypothetical protein
MNYEVTPSARAGNVPDHGFIEVELELSPEDSAKVRQDRPTMSAGYVVAESRSLAHMVESLTSLADAAQSKADSTPNAARCSFYEGQASAYRGAAGMLTDLDDGEAKREPSRSDRERRLLQRLAKRCWRSTGRRLRGQGNAERDRDQARVDRDMFKRRAARYEAVLAELPADCWPESEGAPAAAAALADRAKRVDTATAEIARLRARVRVEAADIDRSGVTRAHAEAWLRANPRWESRPNGLWIWKPSNGGSFTTLTDDKRPDELAYAVQWFASREQRPGLDILNEMAEMQLGEAQS